MTDLWSTVVSYWETDPMLVALVASVAIMLALILVGFCLVCYTCCKLSGKPTGQPNKAQSGKMVSFDSNAWSQGFDNTLFFYDDNHQVAMRQPQPTPPPTNRLGVEDGSISNNDSSSGQVLDTRKIRHHDVGHDFMYIARSNSNPVNPHHPSCHSSPICSQLAGGRPQSVCSLVSSVAASTFNPNRDVIHQPASSTAGHAGFASIHRRHVRPTSAYLRQPDMRWQQQQHHQRHPPLSRRGGAGRISRDVDDSRACGGAVLDLSEEELEEEGETDSSETVIVTSLDAPPPHPGVGGPFPSPPPAPSSCHDEDVAATTIQRRYVNREQTPAEVVRPLSECFLGQSRTSSAIVSSGTADRPHSFMDSSMTTSWPPPPPPDLSGEPANDSTNKVAWTKKNNLSGNRVKLKVAGTKGASSADHIPLVTMKKKSSLSPQSSSDQTNE